MKKLILLFSFLFPLTSFLLLPLSSLALSPAELLRAIDEKSRELQEINTQIQETQKNLLETEEKGKTLNREISKSNYQLNQLNLSIKSSQIKIEKLELEIDSLAYDINDKEKEIIDKKGAITSFLRELQEKNQENTLMIFLKNKSLAESLFEAQTISSLNAGLAEEIGKLQVVKTDLSNKLTETNVRKADIEAESRNLKYRRAIAEDQKKEKQELLRTTKNQENLYQEQLKDLEKQQAEIAAEIEEVEKELRLRIDPSLLPIPRPGVFAWPAGSTRLSQNYGVTSFSRYYRGKYHNGVDIAGPIGTEIYAAEAGEVISIGDQDRYCPRGAYGKYIVIKHDNNLTTLYAHLSQMAVRVGERVNRGQVIGYMGRTGFATGSHLHFTVWSTQTYLIKTSRVCGPMPVGGDLNPLQYLERPN